MAVDPKPSVDDYWSANPALGNQKIIQTMPRRRFLSMQRYFHVNDPAKDPTRMTDKEKGKELLENNPFYKVSPLMDAIRKNSMALYNSHFLFVLRFYGPVNPVGSCRARSVYLTTRLLGRLSPLSG